MPGWKRATAAEIARLQARTLAPGGAGGRFFPESLSSLPAPVAGYFSFALTPGQQLVRTARIEHAGDFRTRIDGRPSRFTSVQHFSARPPGFVWDATIRMMRIIPVRVRDSYLAGRGAMLGRIGGLVPVVDQSGTSQLASGALSRWLGEAIWLPTVLLPGNGVEWEAIDSGAARATLTDGSTRVSMDVDFGPDGRIVRISADRYRDVDGRGVITPWIVRTGDYAKRDGMMIPLAASVEWALSEGPFVYWQGRITAAAYEFEPGPD